MTRIWLVAAENGALPGGKVGGVGDVVRDLPQALAAIGLDVRVITPSYGMLHRLPGASLHREVNVSFAGQNLLAEVYRVPVAESPVEHFVIEHPLLSPRGPGQIYVSDDSGGPYEIDAAKFAFFNAALAAWVNVSDAPPDVLHLNDWHTGLIPALRDFGDQDAPLKKVRIVFTIHNLAYQGVRPLQDIDSSLQTWFPHLLEHSDSLKDTKYEDCVNFMASAIRLADGVNTVSPSYAMEIQRPGDPLTGFSGGEGLEVVLGDIHARGRLSGIVNGCMYPSKPQPQPDWDELLKLFSQRPEIMNATKSAVEWFKDRQNKPPENLLLSIGRVVDQKVPLFLEPVNRYPSALQAILTAAGPETLFIMLGSGDEELEERFVDIARSNENFLYLRGYVDALSAPLYAIADLFLMPSSFEPCGISQMLAMRAGQPCVVHAVGGLKDTVEDNVTGFVFDGDTPRIQAENFVSTVQAALSIKREDSMRWQDICSNAAARRFSWEVAAKTYNQELYQHV
jgi:starch synthase